MDNSYYLLTFRATLQSINSDIKLIKLSQKKECLSLVENATNLGMAVHWLPGGYLWSGKLSNAAVGTLGVVSSVIGLVKLSAFK